MHFISGCMAARLKVAAGSIEVEAMLAYEPIVGHFGLGSSSEGAPGVPV